MGYGTIHRWPTLLGHSERTRCLIGRSDAPFGLTFSQLRVGQLYVNCPDIGVETEQRLRQKRHAANFAHVFGDITATGFQIRGARCFFEDFGRVELDAAFMGNRRRCSEALVEPTEAASATTPPKG